MHSVLVLNGIVTSTDIYRACKEKFDIIHLGGHGGECGFALSNGEVITAAEIAQLCRMSQCSILYCNACEMGQVAGYVSRHGGYITAHNRPAPRYIIYSQLKLDDKDSWQTPLAFYHALADQQQNNIKEIAVISAYQTSDGDGINYNMLLSPTFLEQIFIELQQLRRQYHNVELTTRQLTTIIVAIATIVLGIVALYMVLTH